MSTRPFDRVLFERVFSDAQVIDIDLSYWDKFIRLWVLADHYENWSDRCPTVIVEFINVKKMAITMPKHNVLSESPEKHLQWNIDDFKIEENSELIKICLSGSRSSPIFEIECESITIRSASIATLDKLFPGWNSPFSGFARPGIETLAKLREI